MAKGEVIIFQHVDFRGHHRHIFDTEPNLNHSEDQTMNDKMSSFVVVSGIWKFYRHANYQVPYDGEFGPGRYRWVEANGVENDQVSSMKCIKAK